MSRLEDMQNALNGCGFCAGCGIHMAFSVRRRAIVLAFLGSLACKIEKTKNPNCDAYHLRVSIFAVKVEATQGSSELGGRRHGNKVSMHAGRELPSPSASGRSWSWALQPGSRRASKSSKRWQR